MSVSTTNQATGRPAPSGRHTEARRQAVDAARAIMVESGGVGNVTIAAVAKALKFTSPALYRYFPGGRDELLRAVHHAALEDVAAQMGMARDMQDPDDLSAQMYVLTHAVFSWSVAHPGEFSLLMGPDFRQIQEGAEESNRDVATMIGGMYLPTLEKIARRADPAFWPRDDEVPAELRDQIHTYAHAISPDHDFPLGFGYVWIRSWRAMFGVISMAAFGHLSFAYGDCWELFEDTFAEALQRYGLEPSDRLVVAGAA